MLLLGVSSAVGAAAATMFVEDTFTDTSTENLVTQHTGEIGGTWAANSASSSAAATFSDANRIFCGTAGSLYPSGTPADADYYVEADFYTKSLQNNGNGMHVGVRWSTNAITGYLFGWVGDTGGSGHGNWKIRLANAAAFSDLAVVTAETLTVSTHYIAKLVVSGTVLTGFINGVQVATYDTVSDGFKITTAGVPSLRMTGATSNTTGMHVDYFRAYD